MMAASRPMKRGKGMAPSVKGGKRVVPKLVEDGNATSIQRKTGGTGTVAEDGSYE